MGKWNFEPGHTAAEFCARHMMVSWVRGHFKNVEGTIEFDPDNPAHSSVETTIKTTGLWSGDPDRDGHLKSPDFLDVENHPTITFNGNQVEVIGETNFKVTGDLAIRGITKTATLDVVYLGQWETPFWVGNEDKGPILRAGFVATTSIKRHDFNVTWDGEMAKGGNVVGADVRITIDVEALLLK